MAAHVKRQIMLLFLSICLLVGSKLASQVENRPTVEDLKKYLLEKDYPEVFGDSHYHVRIEDVLDVDIDNDGKRELVVQFHPHYRQSASVAIYKVSPELELTRVTEGLAPGPMQQVSGEYLDSHELGEAVDFTIGQGQGNPREADQALQIALAKFGGVVAYRNFYHVDGRKKPTSFVDLRNVEPPFHAQDCRSFEFSKVRQIAAGGLREDSSKNYLAAWVGDEIYVYLIRGISSQGMLDKKLWIVKAPADFKGFIPRQGLAYKTKSGIALLTLAN
jgi:hypothetical protein